jgi:hypothetical protein
MRRCLSIKHPLYKPLFPHVRYTIMINLLARADLVSPKGVFTTVSSLGGPNQALIKVRAGAGG